MSASAIVNIRHSAAVTLTIELPSDVLAEDLVVTADENLRLIAGPGPEGVYGGGYTFEPLASSESGQVTVVVAKLGISKSITVNRDDNAAPNFGHELRIDCR